jgi:hypothetical protein
MPNDRTTAQLCKLRFLRIVAVSPHHSIGQGLKLLLAAQFRYDCFWPKSAISIDRPDDRF